MRPSAALFALAILVAAGALAQTATIMGGIAADSANVWPIVDYRRITGTGDVRSVSLAGWHLVFARELRVAPARRNALAIAITPYAANNSDHIYVDGRRVDDLTFRDSEIEASGGRLDVISERWSSDLRLVALYERLKDVDDATADFWRYPYAGVRSRIAWSRITAQDPLLLTFRGSEVVATAEVFGGRSLWTRFELVQRAGKRFGMLDLSEHAEVMAGSNLDDVSAFLVGGSWPIAGIHALYGYRYGEFRVDRAGTATGDASFHLRDYSIGAHVSAMRSRDETARGAAIDVTHSWRGLGIRGGVAMPSRCCGAERDAVVYLSLFAAKFVTAH